MRGPLLRSPGRGLGAEARWGNYLVVRPLRRACPGDKEWGEWNLLRARVQLLTVAYLSPRPAGSLFVANADEWPQKPGALRRAEAVHPPRTEMQLPKNSP